MERATGLPAQLDTVSRWLRIGPWVALGVTLFAASAPGAADQPPAGPAATLDYVMRHLPGDYQSVAHAGNLGEIVDGLPQEKANQIRSIYRQVDLPHIGRLLIYLEEYRDADLERIRLYKFWIDEPSGQIRLRLLNPLEPELLIGAHEDLSRIKALSDDDFSQDRPQCELTFSSTPGGIVTGRMGYRACTLPTAWVDYELHVNPAGHWVCFSRRSLPGDQVIWQQVPGTPCVYMARQQDQ